MKTRTLCAAILTAVIATTVIGSHSALAAENQLSGKGKVEFKEDIVGENEKFDPEDPEILVRPEDPEDIIDNKDKGPITIDRVTVLDFGKQEISTKTQTYPAKAISVIQTDKDGKGGTKVDRGPWVQWTDKRAGKDHKYAIKAELTQQFTLPNTGGKAGKLEKATIDYTNGVLNTSQENLAYWPDGNPGNFTLGFGTDNPGAGKKVVFDNLSSEGAVGLGTYTMEFGQSASFTQDKVKRPGAPTNGIGQAGNSVFLNVPAQTIEKGNYEAVITWSIEYTPEA